jgi:hypothetical protein
MVGESKDLLLALLADEPPEIWFGYGDVISVGDRIGPSVTER